MQLISRLKGCSLKNENHNLVLKRTAFVERQLFEVEFMQLINRLCKIKFENREIKTPFADASGDHRHSYVAHF